MKIVVDQQKCIGSGQCVLGAGEVFDQSEEGVVVLLQERPPAGLEQVVREAADVCPSRAIAVIDDE